MKKFTFKKGIRVPHNKITCGSPLTECPAPSTVYIPLAQHIGKPAVCCVSVGDKVKAGTIVGRADGFVSANVFSSVSGTVKAVERRKTPNGACAHVVIENDFRYETESLPKLANIDKDVLIERIAAAGIVGMGGAGFPASVKYSPKKSVDTFILNAAECEPYITCDHRLLLEQTECVLKGAAYLAAALGLDSFKIGIEDNKLDAVERINAIAAEKGMRAEVILLESRYPQGAEKQLIYAVTRRKVPRGGLPADVGVAVGNVHTAYAVCDAVVNGTPLYRRAMTGAGAVERPSNIWVRTGSKLSDCLEFCGGAKADCVKTLAGGPMMGTALDHTDYAVTKTTGALLLLDKKLVETSQPQPCINCGKCARACPMNLMPMYIDAYTLAENYGEAKRYGALDCIECGCCAFTCPAKRTIVQSVKVAKRKIKELGL